MRVLIAALRTVRRFIVSIYKTPPPPHVLAAAAPPPPPPPAAPLAAPLALPAGAAGNLEPNDELLAATP